MTKLALAMIVKGADEEAVCLARCLENVSPHVDGIFVTITQPNEAVRKVAESFGAHISEFEWCHDFAAARNFNFSQVPKDYTHILWCDADDVFRGLDKLKPILDDNPMIDAFAFFYLYEFDEYNRPTVVHQKTQVIKNNGALEWKGKLHEDFMEKRNVRTYFVKDIERMHFTDEARVQVASARNVEVAEKDVETNKDDPRVYWNLGNSLFSAGRLEESAEAFHEFMERSNSDEEKYVARLRIAHIKEQQGNQLGAVDDLRYAIGTRPEYPDAYHALGELFLRMRRFEEARDQFLLGLVKKPPYYQVIVYNPRDYDYNPLMSLARTYFHLSRPDQALTCLQGAAKIYPKKDNLSELIKEMEKDKKEFDQVLKHLPKLQDLAVKGDKEKLKKALDKVPKGLWGHPAIALIRNTNFIREESSGRDLVFYCGPTTHEWNPELFKTKGFGGSEEAIVNLARELATKGWNVTVYNNCGHPAKEMIKVYDGVTYIPFWMWNFRDKQDIVVIWRHPRALDYPINAEKVFIDVHDMVAPGEFTPERLEKVTKVMFKTNFHRSVFKDIPDEKVAVIPNGMDFALFDQDVEKDQYLIVNTSSPDRSLDTLPEVFKRVKERVPEAKCVWAYGWSVFDDVHGLNNQGIAWKKSITDAMKDAGIEDLGRVTQKEAAELYLRANVLGYPSEFAEIDCITVKKAQACGAIPVTTDFGAFEESVQYGVKVKSPKNLDNWDAPYKMGYGIEGEEEKQAWVDAVVEILQTPINDRSEMKEWTKKFAWPVIADLWNNTLDS